MGALWLCQCVSRIVLVWACMSFRVCVRPLGTHTDGTSPLKLAHAYECGMKVSALCGAGTAPCERPELEARIDTRRVLSALACMTSLIVDNGEELARQAAAEKARQAAEAVCDCPHLLVVACVLLSGIPAPSV